MDLRRICTKGASAVLLAPVTLLAGSVFADFAACITPPAGTAGCFTSTPTHPGCTNHECCTTVCNFDDFCCTVEWDDFCVGLAGDLCVVAGPVGDLCADAISISNGLSATFDSTGAHTDGPPHPICMEFAAPADEQVHLDMFFSYNSTTNGSVTFTTCNVAAFDTKVAVYRNPAGCTSAQLLASIVACDDDQTAGCTGMTSIATAPSASGDHFIVRVGGFDDTAFGTFQINVLPQPGGGLPGCGTAANACSATSTTPGCSNGNCCTVVCLASDGFCCTTAWDTGCVAEAAVLCGTPPCSTLSTAGTTPEGIACGILGASDPNGGCNVTPAAFTPLALGVTRSGTIAAVNTSPPGAPPGADRDLDWYEITLPAALDTDGSGTVQLNLTLNSEFPSFVVVDDSTCAAGTLSAVQFSVGCVANQLHFPVSVPGVARLIISSGFPGFGTGALVSIFDGIPCGTGNDYTIRATVSDPVTNFCVGSAQPCGSPGPNPGCSDGSCCNQVCGIDPFCCQGSWDQGCADEAGSFCSTCVLVTTGATATEPEPCGNNSNGGCNATPPAFTPLANNAIMHGTGFTAAATRDTDWYSFSTTAAQDLNGDGQVFVTLTLQSEFPAVGFMLNSDCGALVLLAPAYDSSQCVADQDFAFVPAPGSFIAFVAPGTTAAGIFSGVTCGGALGNDYLLTLNIVDVPPPPVNDSCSAAIPIFNGNTPFSNVGATTEAATPDLPVACDEAGDNSDIGSDIWYLYTATCTGNVTISLCAGTDFDARMAVYAPGSVCGASLSAPIACADDTCGTVGGPPTVTFAATSGLVYRVRVGGFSLADGQPAAAGGIGQGVINIACASPCGSPGCPSNLNGLGGVDTLDLGILLSAWSLPLGTEPGCQGTLPCCADLNGSGTVNSLDLGILLGDWVGLPGGDPDCP